jgi:hypothetical protein
MEQWKDLKLDWLKRVLNKPLVAPQILIVLFLIYLFDNIIQLISLRSL